MLMWFKRLLVLKGPAGAGKTATVMAVAKALRIHVVEWMNPKESHFSSAGYLSMSAQFDDFLGRSSKFGSLEFGNTASDGNGISATEEPISGSSKKNLILLEEFPNTFTSTSAAATSFRTSLLHYLAANPPPSTDLMHHQLCRNQVPVVMIITESHLAAGTSSEDVFSAHRLLGPDILGHPSVNVIEFNTMAPTYVVKALELVVRKEARQSGRRRTPSLPLLKTLAETGDIRSAIAALEFLCLRKDDGDDWGGRVASKAKTKKSSSALTKSEKDSLERITRREASLGIFHAVGKVVYNKREDVSDTNLPTDPPRPLPPPDHMKQHTRHQISLVSPDELIDSTGTDRQTFIAALHENYVSSCEGISFMDSFNGCLDALSDSDILGSERSGRIGPRGSSGPQRGASDLLRQDEIGFHLAVRGILFALPFPVKRSTSLSSGRGKGGEKGDGHKMFYPASVRLWKEIEEVKSLVDRWAERYDDGFLHSERSSGPFQPGATMVPGFGARGTNAGALRDGDGNRLPCEADFRCQSKNASRVELILETLPYLAHIERCRTRSLRFRELAKITEFPSLNQLSHAGRDPDEGCRPGLGRHPDVAGAPGSSTEARKKGQPGSVSEEADIGKLWLSDDDIEDE
jgi:cell cycle checkpoint protein